MKRRINNLHKGMFKGNKTSNIIELHSRKRPQEKEKENQNINISQYKYINNENNNISKNNINKSKIIEQKKENSPNKKEKAMHIYNNTFSDSDSSNNKSMKKTKFFNKYAKSGTYFKRLRQQVIDKFISGKPLISIERMYNNPEVKKMFGIQNNTEKTNYKSNDSYKNEIEDMPIEEERDRRIPPSKFIPIGMGMPNVSHNNNIRLDNNCNNNLNEINNINENEELFPNNFNTMMKINQNQNYYHKNNQNLNVNKNNVNIFQNNKYIKNLYQKQQGISNADNSRFMDTNEINDINDNNNSERGEYDFDAFQEINNEYRKKRISNNEENNYIIQLNGRNENINNEYNNNFYKNENNRYNEVEDINNLLNNLKYANNNNNNYNLFSYESKDNDSYFNKLLIKKDRDNNFINYLNNQPSVNETSEQVNEIGFDTPQKK